MADLMCYAEGSSDVLVNAIDNAYKTMEVVEAAYLSCNEGETPIMYNEIK